VVLYEKDDCLGGTLTMAAAAPFKADMKQYLDWAIRATMDAPNIKVKLSTEATLKRVKSEKPDAVIIAGGAVPLIPCIPGIDRENVVSAGDVDMDKAKVGGRVVVAGAGLTGSETALYLAQQGKKVTLIDMLSLEQIDANAPFVDSRTLRNMLQELKVDIITEVKLEAVTDTVAVVADKNGKKTEIPCDTVILALGVQPREEVVAIFADIAPDIKVIGDCHNQRGNLYSATSEGFFAAIEL
jgi:pyruvate/2-oxoglutarate dehydrogenase complex dihydrolipoamide dehydrogenase (E3) component